MKPRGITLRYVVVYNPIAGQGRSATVAGDVQRLLEERGHSVEARASEFAGHIAEMAAELGSRGGCDRLLVLGGDGSLREAAAGLLAPDRDMESLPELGILPFGTGNVVARELGLPLDPLRAAAAMESSGSVLFDVGWASADSGAREPFLAMAGVGFDASVTNRIGAARAATWGKALYRRSASALYVGAGLAELFALGPPRFSVLVDGESVATRACAAVVSNTETYGKGMAMSPGASPSDGIFDLSVRSSATPWAGATSLMAAQMRKEGPGWAATRARGRAVIFDAVSPGSGRAAGTAFPWQLDGDPMTPASRLEITLQPSALRLIGEAK